MNPLGEKPLNINEVLDLTFRVMKKHFSVFFISMLILMGPVYLVQLFVMGGNAATSFLGIANPFDFSKFETMNPEDMVSSVFSPQMMGVLFLLSILYIIAVPMAKAAIYLLVDQVRKKEIPEAIPSIKRAFSRFFPLLGGSIVIGFIFIGLFFGIALLVSLLILIFGGSGGFENMSSIGIGFISSIILGLAILFLMFYFMVRLGFYFPAILFERVSPGVTKSWNLTKGKFWPLLGKFFIIYILIAIVSGITQTIFSFLGVIGMVFIDIVSIFTTLFLYISSAIIYFDLVYRNKDEDPLVDEKVEESNNLDPIGEDYN